MNKFDIADQEVMNAIDEQFEEKLLDQLAPIIEYELWNDLANQFYTNRHTQMVRNPITAQIISETI